jgi:hypothetical protein
MSDIIITVAKFKVAHLRLYIRLKCTRSLGELRNTLEWRANNIYPNKKMGVKKSLEMSVILLVGRESRVETLREIFLRISRDGTLVEKPCSVARE